MGAVQRSTGEAQRIFDAARSAHEAGNVDVAERGYREALASPSLPPDTRSRARWNLSSIRSQAGANAEAADILQPLRHQPGGALTADAELHIKYARARTNQFESAFAAGTLGPQRASWVDGLVIYEPAPIAAVREAVRAYNDVHEALVMPGVRAALPQSDIAAFEREAELGVNHLRLRYQAFIGHVQEAAIGRVMTAANQATIQRLEAKNRPVPDVLRARMGITDGPYADGMQERTTELRAATQAAGMDAHDYLRAWQVWLSRKRAATP